VPDPDLFGVPKEGILSNPQRLNRYSYCLNNPYKYVDPDGRFAILAAYVAALGADMPGLNADMMTLSVDWGKKDWIAVTGDLVGLAVPILPAAMTGRMAKGFVKGSEAVIEAIGRTAYKTEDVLVLGRGPLSRLQKLAAEEGGRVSSIASQDARAIFKQNYRDIRSADKIIQYMDNIPTTLDEAVRSGGQFSRAEVYMINQRKDLLGKTIRKFE
jgi:hypothetical protein